MKRFRPKPESPYILLTKPPGATHEQVRNPGNALKSNFPSELVPEVFVLAGTHRDVAGNIVFPAGIAMYGEYVRRCWVEAVEEIERCVPKFRRRY